MNLMTIMLQNTAEASPRGGGMSMIIFMVILFGVMYFFMIRPQQKKQKEMVKFRNALEKGQKVITAGGIYGTVKEVKENYIVVEVGNNVTLNVEKSMIMPSAESAADSK